MKLSGPDPNQGRFALGGLVSRSRFIQGLLLSHADGFLWPAAPTAD
jgi:hypothetical protein